MDATKTRARHYEETVVERGSKPGRPLPVDQHEGEAPQLRRYVVRRTAWLDLDLDRRLRRLIGKSGRSYSSAVEEALRQYVETGT